MTDEEPKARTHTAWAIQQQRARRTIYTRALEIGDGYLDGSVAHLFLDRLPLGGFSGYVKLLPKGARPAPPAPRPARPDEAEGD